MIYVKHFLPCYAVMCLNFAERFKTQYIQTIVLGCLFLQGGNSMVQLGTASTFCLVMQSYVVELCRAI